MASISPPYRKLNFASKYQRNGVRVHTYFPVGQRFVISRPLTAQEEIYWRLTYNDQIHPATRELVGAARANGSTVHAALAAAFVLSMRRLASRFKTDPVRIISPVNTRAELGAGNALGMYFTSPQSSFEPSNAKSFWDIAAQARADIATSSSREALLGATAAM
jgi:hypothetical protein